MKKTCIHPTRRSTFLIATILLTGIIAACNTWQKPKLFSESQFLLDTLVEITVASTHKQKASDAISAAYSEMRRIEALLSRYQEGSQIAEINRHAGTGDFVRVNQEVIDIVRRSLTYTELTQQTFDITLGPIIDLWGIGTEHERIPGQIELERALFRVGAQHITFQEQQIQLSEPGMLLDLGAIAKGYSIDRAIQVLQAQDIQSALVNAGGDIRSLGTKPDNTPWRIGIQHPREEGILAIVEVQNAAIATSGDYERFFVSEENRRYHHILDPQTGYPARGCQSVTILTTTAEAADALATAVFVMGPEQGKAFLESQPNVEGMIIRDDGEMLVSSGFLFVQ